MSWQMIGLFVASYFDRTYSWAGTRPKYSEEFYLGDRPQFTGADYFIEQLEQKQLIQQAQQNLQILRPNTDPDPYFVPTPLGSPYGNVSLEEKIRIQNLLSGGQ